MKVPGQGFVGAGQQTMAAQLVIGGAMRNGNGTRKRRRKSARKIAKPRSTRKRRVSARSTKRPARLVKGSAAAKRYMASIRRKRKR